MEGGGGKPGLGRREVGVDGWMAYARRCCGRDDLVVPSSRFLSFCLVCCLCRGEVFFEREVGGEIVGLSDFAMVSMVLMVLMVLID